MEKIIKTFGSAEYQLQLIEIEGKYEVRFTQTNEVFSKEYDYDRACEEFENWKRYYF